MAYILEKIGNTYNLPKKYFTCDAKSDLDGISLVDVPIGSEAYCILEEESYILDSNKQWHKKKISEDATGQVQADLSQTNSTQADYVKGIIRKESLPEGYPYKEIEAILDGTFEFVDNSGIYIHQITDENFTIVDGKSYTVIWDGVTYQCVATTFNGPLVLGNLRILGAGDDTGEPFLFADQGNGQKVIVTNTTTTTHTITVRGEIIRPMDNEYLQNSNITNDLAAGSLKTHGAREATGVDSLAEGSNTISSGNSAHAEGSGTTASGNSAHAEGSGTTASGNSAHAEGSSTIAKGSTAHAEGSRTTANGYHSHAEGDLTIAIGDSSHVEGYETATSGLYSHAEGIGYMQNIIISGEAGATVYTTTELVDPIVMEGSLMVFNDVVRKILSYDSSEKKFTLEKTLNDTAALNSVLAIIVICGIAGGDYSHSEGQGSVAFSESQHVQGKFNIGDSSNKYAHIVGNGSSKTSRSNAHTLDWKGNAWFAGTIEGTSLIIPSSTEGSTKKFKITVDDSGALSATEVV